MTRGAKIEAPGPETLHAFIRVPRATLNNFQGLKVRTTFDRLGNPVCEAVALPTSTLGTRRPCHMSLADIPSRALRLQPVSLHSFSVSLRPKCSLLCSSALAQSSCLGPAGARKHYVEYSRNMS